MVWQAVTLHSEKVRTEREEAGTAGYLGEWS